MKRITMKLLSASAVALVTSSFASAAVHQITYSYFQSSKYTSTKPLVGGIPDPGNVLNGSNPIIADHPGYTPSAAVTGTGWLDTTTGQIYFAPIDIEYNVVSGSYGAVGWSQTLNGAFTNSNTTFTMTGNATVNSGSMVCEIPGGSACNGVGGLGAAPKVLAPSQTYPDPITDEFGDVVVPGGPKTLTSIIFSGAIAEGVTGQYLHQSDVQPAYEDTTIDIVVGKVVYLPVPAAAWLFGPSLITLVAGKRLRRVINKI